MFFDLIARLLTFAKESIVGLSSSRNFSLLSSSSLLFSLSPSLTTFSLAVPFWNCFWTFLSLFLGSVPPSIYRCNAVLFLSFFADSLFLFFSHLAFFALRLKGAPNLEDCWFFLLLLPVYFRLAIILCKVFSSILGTGKTCKVKDVSTRSADESEASPEGKGRETGQRCAHQWE